MIAKNTKIPRESKNEDTQTATDNIAILTDEMLKDSNIERAPRLNPNISHESNDLTTIAESIANTFSDELSIHELEDIKHIELILITLCIYPQAPYVSVSYTANKYENTKYTATRLRKMIQLLAKHDFLLVFTGGQKTKRTTRIRAKEKISNLISQLKLQNLKIIRQIEPIAIHHRGEETYLESTPEIEKQASFIRSYNAFLRGFEIIMNGNYIYPTLKRVYNNEELTSGGRYYDPSYQNYSKDKARSTITINGEKTIELDYSATFPSMLYALYFQKTHQDPYGFPIKLQWHIEPKTITKLAVNILINADNARSAKYVIKEKLAELVVKSGALDDSIKAQLQSTNKNEYNQALKLFAKDATNVVKAIEKSHPELIRWFYSGEGLKLMKHESDIATYILGKAQLKNIPVLVVHDSYIAPISSKQWLYDIMIEASKIVLGHPLSAK